MVSTFRRKKPRMKIADVKEAKMDCKKIFKGTPKKQETKIPDFFKVRRQVRVIIYPVRSL